MKLILKKTNTYLNHCNDGINLSLGDKYHKIFYDSFARIFHSDDASNTLKKEVNDDVIYCNKFGEFNLE